MLGGDGIARGDLLNDIVVPPHDNWYFRVPVIDLPRGLLKTIKNLLIPDSLFPAPHNFLSEVINTRLLLGLAEFTHKRLGMLIEIALQFEILELSNIPTLEPLLQLLHDCLLILDFKGVIRCQWPLLLTL